jgi:gamma-glutamyltranspeptidase/glutathione hydrolase
VVAGAGFILNNEMDDFSVKPGAPNLYGAVGGKANAIAGNKRPLSSMTPTIITKKNKVWMVVGTPGGTTIPTSVFQTIINVSEFDLSLPEALQAGRFHHQWLPDQIFVEPNGLPEEVVNTLKSMGHTIHPRDPIGRVEAIIRLPDGNWQGAADHRGNDAAKGF